MRGPETKDEQLSRRPIANWCSLAQQAIQESIRHGPVIYLAENNLCRVAS